MFIIDVFYLIFIINWIALGFNHFNGLAMIVLLWVALLFLYDFNVFYWLVASKLMIIRARQHVHMISTVPTINESGRELDFRARLSAPLTLYRVCRLSQLIGPISTKGPMS